MFMDFDVMTYYFALLYGCVSYVISLCLILMRAYLLFLQHDTLFLC